uniref:Schlafen AlbA-2 domain-containing protein n=2 Tax=Ixodes ricinus TaxID=34613 RepID=V5H9Y7_IXORI
MTRSFVACFATLHFERKCVAGVYVCTICQEALTILYKIRLAIKQDPQGRWMILNNVIFMRLLLNLCNTDSSVGPSICAVNGRDVRLFYETGLLRSLQGCVEILQGEAGIKRWKLFLGKAVERIRPLTYVVAFSRPFDARKIPAGAATAWAGGHNRNEGPDSLFETPQQKRLHVSTLSKLDVVGCQDDQHLWVYCSAETRESVQALTKALTEFLESLGEDGALEDAPSVGSIVGLKSSGEQARRVLVLQVKGNLADVWAMDYGDIYQVSWSVLLDLPPSFKCIPPQVSLCILKVSFHANMTHRMLQLGGFKVLCGLLCCPDYDTRILAVSCLLQSCRHNSGRSKVAESGCVMTVLGRLKELLQKRHPDNCVVRTIEKQHLVNLLQAIFVHNEELVDQFADSELLQILTKIQRCSAPGSVLHRDVDHCLATILGPAYWKRRLPATATFVAMTPEKLLEVKESTDQQGLRNEVECGPHIIKRLSPASLSSLPRGQAASDHAHFYLRSSLVDFDCDDTHELRPVTNMKLASVRTLAKLVCSFLNTWQACTIYYGITRDRFVQGVHLDHAERDALRLGIDAMVKGLQPRLIPSSISVEFVPVLRYAGEIPPGNPKYVVEVQVCGVPQTVYTISNGTCYLREGGLTYEARANSVRGWIAKQEE